MKRITSRFFILFIFGLLVLWGTMSMVGHTAVAQEISHGGHAAGIPHQYSANILLIIGLLELPFLLIAVFFAFRTASALKGGVFGRGMLLIALGALVMAIGHLHMQVNAMWGVDMFGAVFGNTLGLVVWVVALVITWGLTGAGFYSIYKASRAG